MNKKAKNLMVAGITGLVALSSAAVFANSTAVPTTTATTTSATATEQMPGKGFGMGGPRGMMGMGGEHKGGKGGRGFTINSAAKAAITANDYAAFTAAIKGTDQEGKVTQTQFNDMVSRQQRNEAKKTAIANNDYAAFVKASTPTQAEFDEIVAREKSRKAIDAALAANNYSAFTAATKNTPMADITQAQFTKMAEGYKNRPNKDNEQPVE